MYAVVRRSASLCVRLDKHRTVRPEGQRGEGGREVTRRHLKHRGTQHAGPVIRKRWCTSRSSRSASCASRCAIVTLVTLLAISPYLADSSHLVLVLVASSSSLSTHELLVLTTGTKPANWWRVSGDGGTASLATPPLTIGTLFPILTTTLFDVIQRWE